MATYTQNEQKKKDHSSPLLFIRRSLQIELANCRSLGTGRHNSQHHNKKKKNKEERMKKKVERGFSLFGEYIGESGVSMILGAKFKSIYLYLHNTNRQKLQIISINSYTKLDNKKKKKNNLIKS